MHSMCYLHNTLDHFVCSAVGQHFLVDVFLCNVRGFLGIINFIDTSVRLLLKCSNLLIIITLITVFCIFRQNLDSLNIPVENLFRNMLHVKLLYKQRNVETFNFYLYNRFLDYRLQILVIDLHINFYDFEVKTWLFSLQVLGFQDANGIFSAIKKSLVRSI